MLAAALEVKQDPLGLATFFMNSRAEMLEELSIQLSRCCIQIINDDSASFHLSRQLQGNDISGISIVICFSHVM